MGLFLGLVSESAGSPIHQDWGLKRKLLLILNGEGRCKLSGQKAGILSEDKTASKLVLNPSHVSSLHLYSASEEQKPEVTKSFQNTLKLIHTISLSQEGCGWQKIGTARKSL